MTNRPIILRLSNDDGSQVRVLPKALAAFIEAIETPFQSIPRNILPLGNEQPNPPEVSFKITAMRPACLEIVFFADFNVHVQLTGIIELLPEDVRSDAVAFFADVATIGGFILTAYIFAYSKWRTNDISAPQLEPNWLNTILSNVQDYPSGSSTFRRIRRLALALGAVNVSMEIEEGVEFVIVDASDRRRTFVPGNALTTEKANLVPNGNIECRSGATNVRFDREARSAFLAMPTDAPNAGPVVAIWSARNTFPKEGERLHIEFDVIQRLDEVEFEDDSIPEHFDSAVAAILIKRARSDRFE